MNKKNKVSAVKHNAQDDAKAHNNNPRTEEKHLKDAENIDPEFGDIIDGLTKIDKSRRNNTPRHKR